MSRKVAIPDNSLELPDQEFGNCLVEDLVLRARLDELEKYCDVGPITRMQRRDRLIRRIRENELRGEL